MSTPNDEPSLWHFAPSLMVILETNPPQAERAREELGELVRELGRLKGGGKLTIELSRVEAKVLHDEIGDIPKTLVKPKLLELFKRLDNFVGIDWVNDDGTERKRKRK